MPVISFNEENFSFPPLSEADEEGLLLIGGRVTPERVLQAYKKGIFPWYSDDEIPLWWSPDPRFVLFPENLHISRSMQKVLHKGPFTFRTNTAFMQVIAACATVTRNGESGTWITPEMEAAFVALHRQGFAHSGEAWLGNDLAGGIYGIRLGSVFFGESMFSRQSNASKFAFIHLVQQLQKSGVQLVDCQVYSPHVESLGAHHIPRSEFVQLLTNLT